LPEKQKQNEYPTSGAYVSGITRVSSPLDRGSVEIWILLLILVRYSPMQGVPPIVKSA
jgi:hypothetical protein